MSSRQKSMFVAAGLAAVALLFALSALISEVRLICIVGFCLLAPGYGWSRRMRLKDRGDTAAMTIVLSICAIVVVGTVMAVTRTWSPFAAMVVLVLIGLCGFAPLSGPGSFGKHVRRRAHRLVHGFGRSPRPQGKRGPASR